MIRKTIILTITMLLFCINVNASEMTEHEVKEKIVKQSIEMGIEPALALSIAKNESKFRHNLRSPYGAVGVFQLMPSTARRLGVNPYHVNDNIKGGLMYYKMMYNMFGSTEMALAAYNAGPAIVKKYNKVPPFKETKQFVDNIMTEYHYQKANPDTSIRKASKPPVYKMQVKPKAIAKPVIKVTPSLDPNKSFTTFKHNVEIKTSNSII